MNIEGKNLAKSYGDTCVFQNFSLVIPEGKTTVIMGKSGCGKTTLVRILLGFEQADDGAISGIPDKTAVVFQENRLCSGFTALDNILLVLNVKQKDKKQLVEMVYAEAKKIGLEKEHLQQKIETLSGGMKRRVALLRAVLYDADFLILDEAMQGLDEVTKKKTIDYVKEKAKGKTVLVITHNEEEALQFGGEICTPFSCMGTSK